jgi:hypothetical protein
MNTTVDHSCSPAVLPLPGSRDFKCTAHTSGPQRLSETRFRAEIGCGPDAMHSLHGYGNALVGEEAEWRNSAVPLRSPGCSCLSSTISEVRRVRPLFKSSTGLPGGDRGTLLPKQAKCLREMAHFRGVSARAGSGWIQRDTSWSNRGQRDSTAERSAPLSQRIAGKEKRCLGKCRERGWPGREEDSCSWPHRLRIELTKWRRLTRALTARAA